MCITFLCKAQGGWGGVDMQFCLFYLMTIIFALMISIITLLVITIITLYAITIITLYAITIKLFTKCFIPIRHILGIYIFFHELQSYRVIIMCL